MKRESTIISVVSGKGGVGKSVMAVNLAETLAAGGHSVALVDADFGQGACRILLNETPRASVFDLLMRVREPHDVRHQTASGITLLESVHQPGEADGRERQLFELLDHVLADLRRKHEYVIIDTPAGTDGPVRWALDRADLGLLVLVGEPTAIADAYRLAKLIWQAEPNFPLGSVVNFADTFEEAKSVAERFNEISNHFTGNVTNFLGWVPFSAAVRHSVNQQVPVVRQPGAARDAFEQLAETIKVGRKVGVEIMAE